MKARDSRSNNRADRADEIRLPSFLIIGAQKSGTTSLYRDLLAYPRITFAPDKEANCLVEQSVTSSDGRAQYAALYRHAKQGQVCGDASTAYSKLPDFKGVPERALAVLGGDTRILYIMRDPVERIISHHYHDHRLGRASADIDTEILSSHRFVSYSRYAFQSRPWVDTFGTDQFLAIDFHEYTTSRAASLARILEFLGVEFDESAEPVRTYNSGDRDRLTLTPFWRAVEQSRIYRRVRPMIPLDARASVRRLVLPSPPQRPAGPTRETLEYLISELADDIEEQPAIFGWRSVPWSVGNLKKRYLGIAGSE